MSTWTCVELQMNDADTIKEVLQEMNITIKEHNKPVAMQVDGRGSMKVSIVAAASDNRILSNDIGFFRTKDGNYEMVVSFADKNRKIRIDGREVLMTSYMKQLYGVKKAIKYAIRQGYTLSSKTVDDTGKIKIKLSVGI